MAISQLANNGRNNFKIRVKFHYFFHMLHRLQASALNPRLASTFGSESFVGICAALASACHPRTCGTAICQRWLLGLQFDIKGMLATSAPSSSSSAF
jgi:hypothetical protein